MQSDKENVPYSPSVKEARKRPSLQSPFSAASPSTRPVPKKIVKPLYELGDQNLDATELTDETFDMSSVKTGLSESVVETSYNNTSASLTTHTPHGNQAAPEFLAEHVEDYRQIDSLPCDDNLEESAFGHTSSVNESHHTENNETLKDDSSVQILCDSNLEETATNFTFTETVTTHRTWTRTGEEILYDDTLNSANVTLTSAEVDVEIVLPTACDINLEETSIERTFYHSNEDQTANDDALKDQEQPSIVELPVKAAPAGEIERIVKTFTCCDSNLEQTANETTVFESYTSETTITVTDSSVEESITRTFTTSSKEVPQTSTVISAVVDESNAAWKPEEKITGIETAKNCVEEKESNVGFVGDANLEESCFDDTQSQTPTMESSEGDSVRVFVEAKASPLNSDSNEGHSLANELGELGMKLNQSVDVRIMVSGDVSLMDDMDQTLQDDTNSLSEDSRNFSSVSTALSEIKSSAEVTKSPLLPDTTQYGDVSMDINSSSVIDEANDTLFALNTPVGSASRHQTGDLETTFPGGAVEEQKLSTTLTAKEETLLDSTEDTLFTLDRLEKQSTLPCEIISNEPNEGETSRKGEPHLPFLNDVSVRISRPPSRSFAMPLSPIADLSRSDAGSRASTVRAASDVASDNSPAYSRNRKYNMNDSDISFLMTENRIYEMHLRNAVESPEDLERLRKIITQLEGDKAELHEQLRTVTTELDQYKSRASTSTSEKDELKRKLDQVTKEKEHAERTVSDYEFIVEDLKRRHNKQKEDLHAKVINLEEELESCRAHIRSQTEMTFTSSGLATELNLAKEQLEISEGKCDTAKKRCEELLKSLELEADKNVKLLEQIAEFSEKSERLQKEILDLQREADEKGTIQKSFEEATKRCREMEKNLKNAETALVESNEKVKNVKAQLETAMGDVNMLREIQTESELELIKLKDELASAKEEDEKLQTIVAALRRDIESAASESALKSQLLEEELSRSAEMKEKIAMTEEQLSAGKRALDVTTRELVQLRDDHGSRLEELEKMKSALSIAESKRAETEGRLEETAKSYEKESEQRRKELQSLTAAHLTEKIQWEKEVAENNEKIKDLTQHLEESKDTLVELEESLRKLREENNNLQTEVSLGVQAYEEKAAEMEKASKRINELKEEIDSLHRANDDLLLQTMSADQEKQKKDAEIEKFKSTIADCKGMIVALELERDSLKDQLTAVKERLNMIEEAEQTIHSLRADVATLSSLRDEFESRLNIAEESNKELADELSKVRESYAQAQSESVVLASQKALLEESLQTKEEEYTENLATLKKLKTQSLEYEAAIEQFKVKDCLLSEELEMVKQNLKIEKEAKDAVTKEIAKLEKEKNMLETKLSSLEAELESAKQSTLSDMSITQKTIENLKNQEMELEKRLETAERAAQAAAISKEEIAELKRNLAIREKDIEQLVRERDRFVELEAKSTQQITDLRKENDELKTQINQGSVPVNPHAKEALREIESLKAEVDRLQKDKERLEKEVMYSSCKDIRELQECLVKKEEYIEFLGKQCDDIDELEDKYRKEIVQLCKERDALKAQLEPSSSVPVVSNLLEALTEGVKPLTPDHTMNQGNRVSEEAEKEINSLKAELEALKKEKERLEKVAVYSTCKDVKELQDCLVKKDEYIEFLGKQCDEIDELEAQYKEEIAQLCKERDALKAQIDPSSVPVVPNLRESLKKGVRMLSPDNSYNSMECKALEDYERKIEEFERIVKKLEKEKEQLQRDKLSQNDRIIQQNEELVQLCEQQRKEIEELKRENSKGDETLKTGNITLDQENSTLGGRIRTKSSKLSLSNATERRNYNEGILDDDADKDGVFQSAPSSPMVSRKSLDLSAGPAYEASVIEHAAVTPNRTLHTTLYRQLDRTTKLSDTLESSKKEDSRCNQQ